MTQSEKYVEGQWYGWNGGECPVHPETIVDVVSGPAKCFVNLHESSLAGDFCWSRDDAGPIITFRVVKHHVEPRVIWVNETGGDGSWNAYRKKWLAEEWASKYTTRVAVRYVETPE